MSAARAGAARSPVARLARSIHVCGRPSRGRVPLWDNRVIVLPHLLTIAGNYRIAPMPQRHAAETPSLAATWRRLNTQ